MGKAKPMTPEFFESALFRSNGALKASRQSVETDALKSKRTGTGAVTLNKMLEISRFCA